MKRPHVITEAEIAQMHDETYEVLIAAGPSRSEPYKQIVARVEADFVQFVVRVGHEDVEAFSMLIQAVEKYNDL